MSQTEFHTGKLYPVKIEKSLEETCRAIAARHNIELGEDWQEDFRDAFDEYKDKIGSVQDEEYFIHGENLYRVIDHEESSDEEYFMKLNRNSDGSLSFIGQFYNGGTCFSEMLEEALAILLKRQERMYNENEVELIANEMVNWAIDNVGNPNPQSGRKFDEVISKFKKK